MHNIFHRINFVSTYAFSVLLAVAICFSVSPLLLQNNNDNTNRHYLNASTETVIKYRHYSRITFDLRANLSAVFNWNIKELWVNERNNLNCENMHRKQTYILTRISHSFNLDSFMWTRNIFRKMMKPYGWWSGMKLFCGATMIWITLSMWRINIQSTFSTT